VNRRPTWFDRRRLHPWQRSFFGNRTTRRLPVPPRDGHDSVVRICRCLALEHRQLHDDGSSHGVARAVWSPRDVKTVARPFDLEEASCRGARSETSVNLHTTLRSKGARALRNGTTRGVRSRYEWPKPPPYPRAWFSRSTPPCVSARVGPHGAVKLPRDRPDVGGASRATKTSEIGLDRERLLELHHV
jgi:hypothetical protein